MERTSLEIYREKYQNSYRDRGKDLTENKRFFLELRKAVIRELENDGNCSLFEVIIGKCNENMYYGKDYIKIDLMLVSVLCDIKEGYRKREMMSAGCLSRESYIPYLSIHRENIRWDYHEKFDPTSWEIKDLMNLIDKVRGVVTGGGTNKTEKQEADREESENLAGEGEEKAATVEREAEQKAAGIESIANKNAKEILFHAQEQAEILIRKAKKEAEEIRKAAEKEAEEQAASSADELTARYLSKQQRRMKEEVHDDIRAILAEVKDPEFGQLHDQMTSITNSYQGKWVAAMRSQMEAMEKLQTEFFDQLHDWQKELYFDEFQQLGECYVQLYKMMNVDRLIRWEILFEKENEEENHILEGLNRLNRNLTVFLGRFEHALNRLGVFVYFPSKGEVFDDYFHIPEEEEEDYTDRKVEECIIPGIKTKAGEEDDNVLIRAVVRLEKNSWTGEGVNS